jgi:surfactin synthase thioesterase subunit
MFAVVIALLGMVLGAGLGYALTRALRDQGVSSLAVPIGIWR